MSKHNFYVHKFSFRKSCHLRDNVEKCDRVGHNTIANISLVTSRTFWNARVFGQFISVGRFNEINK